MNKRSLPVAFVALFTLEASLAAQYRDSLEETKAVLRFVDFSCFSKPETIKASRTILGISDSNEITREEVERSFAARCAELLPKHHGGIIMQQLRNASLCLEKYCVERDSTQALCSKNLEDGAKILATLPEENKIKSFLSLSERERGAMIEKLLGAQERADVAEFFRSLSIAAVKKLPTFFCEQREYWFLALYDTQCSKALIDRITTLSLEINREEAECVCHAVQTISAPWWVSSALKEAYANLSARIGAPHSQAQPVLTEPVSKQAQRTLSIVKYFSPMVRKKGSGKPQNILQKSCSALNTWLKRAHSSFGIGLGSIPLPR